MPIKANAEIEAMANQLAALRGQSVEDVVAAALRAELAREPAGRPVARPAKLSLPSAQRSRTFWRWSGPLIRRARTAEIALRFSMTNTDCRAEA